MRNQKTDISRIIEQTNRAECASFVILSMAIAISLIRQISNFLLKSAILRLVIWVLKMRDKLLYFCSWATAL